MSMLAKTLAVGAALAFAEIACAENLELTENKTIDVPSGEVVEYDALTGGAFTLTKAGPGTLVFKAIANADATIVLSGGKLAVRGLDAPPTVFQGAMLYLDASDMSSLRTLDKVVPPEGYVGTIRSWHDMNGSDYACAITAGDNPPFLRAASETVCGLPLLDFGSEYNDHIRAEYGAYMAFYDASSKPLSLLGVQDLLIVASDTEDVKTIIERYGVENEYRRAVPFVGNRNNDYVAFLRGDRSVSGVNSTFCRNASATQKLVSDGEVRFDGVVVASPATTPYPDGLHLVECRPTAAVDCGLLASDRGRWRGGCRLGAVAAFKSQLSDGERQAARNYLLTKFVPAPIRKLVMGDGTSLEFVRAAGLHPVTLSYAGTSSLSGGSLLCDAEEAATGTIVVEGGKWKYGIGASGKLPSCARSGGDVTFNAGWYERETFVPSTQPFFHVDASKASTVTTSSENGTNFVTKWADASGGTVSAGRNGTYPLPFVRAGALNGRSVIDFGAFSIGYRTVGGWGGVMAWSKGCTGVREVFSVAADTEDLVTNHDNLAATAADLSVHVDRGAPFVSSTSKPHFIRGNRSSLATGVPILLGTAASYATAKVMLDGEGVAQNAPYPDGFHIVNIRTEAADMHANAFGCDRTYAYGGTRIAEYFVFTSELSADDRQKLTDMLKTKWFGAESKDVLSYGRLTVGPDAEYVASEAKVSVDGTLSLEGKLSVHQLDVKGRAVFAANASFDGRLKPLAGATLVLTPTDAGTAPLSVLDLKLSGGTVSVELSADALKPFRGQKIPLVSAQAVTGETTFAATGTGAERYDVTLSLENNVLCADIKPRGLMMIIR